jgi:hypothetical protein
MNLCVSLGVKAIRLGDDSIEFEVAPDEKVQVETLANVLKLDRTDLFKEPKEGFITLVCLSNNGLISYIEEDRWLVWRATK